MAIDAVAPKPRVLVVDDDADTVQSTALLFQMQGFDADTALSGPEAVELAKNVHPDLVLLDIEMPKMDGYEVVRLLRDLPASIPPFLVAVTGFAYPADRHRCAEAGFDLHVPKPVDFGLFEQLAATVQRTRQLVAQTRLLTQRQKQSLTAFVDLELEMAGTFLDVADTTRDALTKQRCLEKAETARAIAQHWLDTLTGEQPGRRELLTIIKNRHELLSH